MNPTQHLLFTQSPFDRLTAAERDRLSGGTEEAVMPAGVMLIEPDSPAGHLFVLQSGQVEEYAGTAVVRRYGPGQRFDFRTIVHGPSEHWFRAVTDVACLRIDRSVILDLLRANAAFAGQIYREVAWKLDALQTTPESGQINALMTARVSDAFLQPAVFIDADETILVAGERMRAHQTNALLVREGPGDPHPYGIVTGMNLSKAVFLGRRALDTRVGEVTHTPLVTIKADDFIASALLLMTKHVKRRLVVVDGPSYVGILHEIDLLAFLSTNSHVIAGRIELAGTLPALEPINNEIMDAVKTWQTQGLKVTILNQLVSELNRKLFDKAYGFLAPDSFRDNACLIVMGSEGRGEQTLPTDQDNGLILRDPVNPQDLARFREAFSAVLARFGYPACPGNVMVSNPVWSKTLAEYQADFRRWVTLPDEVSVLRVAIIYDAAAVGGDARLLDQAKAVLFDCLDGNDAYLSQFARSVDAFGSPLGWFHQLVTEHGDQRDAVDIKKSGLFPIVHGIRSLALQKRLLQTSTVARIEELTRLGTLERGFATALTEAYTFLLDLQLQIKLGKREMGGPLDTLVRPRLLSSWQRDMLKHAFQVTQRFQELIRHRFRLMMY